MSESSMSGTGAVGVGGATGVCALCLSSDGVEERYGVGMCAVCRGEDPRIGDVGSIQFVGAGDDVSVWQCACGVSYLGDDRPDELRSVPDGVLTRAVAYHHLTHGDVPASMRWALRQMDASDASVLPEPIRAARLRWQEEWQEWTERAVGDPVVVGERQAGRAGWVLAWCTVIVVSACVGAVVGARRPAA